MGGTAGAGLGCGYIVVSCSAAVRGSVSERREHGGAVAQVTGAGRMLNVLQSHSVA